MQKDTGMMFETKYALIQYAIAIVAILVIAGMFSARSGDDGSNIQNATTTDAVSASGR